MTENELSNLVIGAAIEVHRLLGPGLLEHVYQRCLAKEFTLRGIPFEREVWLPISYKGENVENAYRADFIVGGKLLVELKAVESLAPVHESQVLTYLKLGELKLGLLLNFGETLMKDGIRRVVNSL